MKKFKATALSNGTVVKSLELTTNTRYDAYRIASNDFDKLKLDSYILQIEEVK